MENPQIAVNLNKRSYDTKQFFCHLCHEGKPNAVRAICQIKLLNDERRRE